LERWKSLLYSGREEQSRRAVFIRPEKTTMSDISALAISHHHEVYNPSSNLFYVDYDFRNYLSLKTLTRRRGTGQVTFFSKASDTII
jgi:hypothetical protein